MYLYKKKEQKKAIEKEETWTKRERNFVDQFIRGMCMKNWKKNEELDLR